MGWLSPAVPSLTALRKSVSDVSLAPESAVASSVTMSTLPSRVLVSNETSVGTIGAGTPAAFHALGQLLVTDVDNRKRPAGDL